MSQSGRKRFRDPLGERVLENRQKAKSQIKNTFLGGSLSLHVSTPAETHERVEKARMVVAISRGSFFTPQKIHPDSASLEMHATPEYFKARKMAIYYQFLLYDAPKEEQWVKDTFHGRPVHPDALPSLNRMIGEVDQALLLQDVVSIEEEVQLEANAQLLNLELDEGDDVDCDCNTSNDIQ